MTEQKKNENEVAKQEQAKAPAVAGQAAFITHVLEETKRGFIEANVGLDVDFVHMGEWLVIDKKGNFVERDDESVKYGDSIDVIIGQGEKRWSLWGLESSPEDGQLIVAEKEQADAEAALQEWLQDNPEASSRYSLDMLELRYMCMVVPAESLHAMANGDFPKVYVMGFSPTATIEFGRWAMKVFQGKFKNAGVPARTGVNRIVTRLTTAEKKGANFSWIGIEFNAVGMFNPEDYGIKTDEQ